jgi:hypothetical protein
MPEKAAAGESKWMMSQLKLDSSLYYSIYKINLRHQKTSDSIHIMLNLSGTEKMKLYQNNNKTKENEFKRVLSPNIFQKYMSLLQDIKNKRTIK